MGHSECGDSNSKFTGVLGPMKSVPAYTVKFHVCPCVKLPMAPCGISLSLRKVSRDTCGISLSFLSLRNLPVSGVLSWIFCPCGTRSFVYIYSPLQGFLIIFNQNERHCKTNRRFWRNNRLWKFPRGPLRLLLRTLLCKKNNCIHIWNFYLLLLALLSEAWSRWTPFKCWRCWLLQWLQWIKLFFIFF